MPRSVELAPGRCGGETASPRLRAHLGYVIPPILPPGKAPVAFAKRPAMLQAKRSSVRRWLACVTSAPSRSTHRLACGLGRSLPGLVMSCGYGYKVIELSLTRTRTPAAELANRLLRFSKRSITHRSRLANCGKPACHGELWKASRDKQPCSSTLYHATEDTCEALGRVEPTKHLRWSQRSQRSRPLPPGGNTALTRTGEEAPLHPLI